MDSTIKEIHNLLSQDLQRLNKIIVDHLSAREELIELVSSYLINAGGKRIRPILTILSGKIFHNDSDEIFKLAAAVELIHAATLLHDDVVDESMMRRFKPTANTIWGNKASILVGDFLFSQSFKLMVSSNCFKALTSLSNASAVIIEGEVMQLANLQQMKMIDINQYDATIQAKTAELFGVACEIGAIIAKQSDEICAKMKNFGALLGTIFQMVDDSLDYFGATKEIGKNIGDDFLEGKVTLPLIILEEKLCSTEKDILHKMLASDNRNSEDFAWIQNRMNFYNILCELKNHFLKLGETAKNSLAEIPEANIYKKQLHNLIEFAIDRSF